VPDDIPGIAVVHSQGWRTTYTGLLPQEHIERRTVENRAELWRAAFDASDADIFVACEAKGRIVGFISGGPPHEPVAGYDAELHVFYLLQAVQRRGIGTRLLQTLARALWDRGFRAMSVLVLGSNPSRVFYERSGAAFVEERRTIRQGFEYHDVYYGWPDLQSLLTSG
jgi:GNAT superfamily N-acetyltransferase